MRTANVKKLLHGLRLFNQIQITTRGKRIALPGSMLADLRFALRTLRHNPGFAAIAILSVALGIGANAAIFSLADYLLLRPLPVPNTSEVMVIWSQFRGESIAGLTDYSNVSYPDFDDLRKKSNSFAGLTASRYSSFGFAPDKTTLPQMKFGALVSGDFFSVLGVPPKLGRGFRADEDRVPGRDAVVVLGHDLWETEFASNPDVIGKSIFLNGLPFTVVGVGLESFRGPNAFLRADLYVPLAMQRALAGESGQNELELRGLRGMMVLGRLKPGVRVEQAAAEARLISQQLAQAYPKTNSTCSLRVATQHDAQIHQISLLLVVALFMSALSAVVLLIACANVMNLMLSRGRARSREIAVRLAIGAGRGRLVRQLLTESLIIALLGGALGLLVAQAGTDLFSQIRIPTDIPITLDFRLDPRALLFTVLASVASALLFGLVPALQTTRPELAPALKTGRAGDGKRSRFLGRDALVVAQVAGSLLLLVIAAQTYRGASVLLSSPASFRTDHLLLASFDPSLAHYDRAHTQNFYKRLLEQAQRLPRVTDAALTEQVPMLPGASQQRVVPDGVQLPPGTEAVSVVSSAVSEDYFAVLGIPIVEGRQFAVTDTADSPRVAIVNQLFARKYYPNQSAIGRRFRIQGENSPPVQIVGVARQSQYFFVLEPPVDYMYLPLAQRPRSGMTLVLQTAIPPGDLAGPMRELVRSLDAGQPVIGLRTVEEVYDMRVRKTLDILIVAIGGLGFLGLLLALVGLYGLMTYSVGLRQREIGIRMAIGADRPVVLRMVLKQGISLAMVGIAIGTLLWMLASKSIIAVIQAHSYSWVVTAMVAAALLAAASLGAYLPARRASLVDPNTVLRQE